MPYELKELAAISGMPGLYRLLKAARHGVLVETLDEKRSRSMAPARNKVSLLSEISIYTTDYDVNVPLDEAFERIRATHGDGFVVTNKSSEAELTAFMAKALPEYDRDRVYLSDIKKLAHWYGIVSQQVPYTEAVAEAATETATETAADQPAAATEVSTDAEAKPKKKAAAKKEAAPLSTGGIIETLEPSATAEATGNPEAAAPVKKSRKKAE